VKKTIKQKSEAIRREFHAQGVPINPAQPKPGIQSSPESAMDTAIPLPTNLTILAIIDRQLSSAQHNLK
jgi:hypothetical protein